MNMEQRMCGFNKMVQQPTHLVVRSEFSEKCFLGMLSPCAVTSGGRRVRQIWPRAISFSLGLPNIPGIPKYDYESFATPTTDRLRYKLPYYKPVFSSERAPQDEEQINCPAKEKKNLVMGPKGVPDTRMDRSTDRRSQHQLNSALFRTMVKSRPIRLSIMNSIPVCRFSLINNE
jgi:hypothetical protein